MFKLAWPFRKFFMNETKQSGRVAKKKKTREDAVRREILYYVNS